MEAETRCHTPALDSSQKPGFLSPWLDDEALRTRLAGLGDVVGLDLVRLGTEADEETIKDTAIAQPLIVAAGTWPASG
ncbi:hypothetical protein A5N15_07495 [Rothia kristinae]|uniref:Uncharacterized protein n=1 Tax=Rothia kristinae TaxID=37923 RepID=A0A657IUM1_9MICC|nr:hypothetical protein A5N15_07495 [Rothia kristinae]